MTTHPTPPLTALLLLSALSATLCGPAALGADTPTSTSDRNNRFTLDHFNQIVRLSDPQIAPDGKFIALIVERAELDTNRWSSELVLVDVATGNQRALTPGRKSVRHPRWSPSGNRLAFLDASGSGKDDATQIFILPMNGGEAQRITKSPTDVQHFAWRPDGDAIAFAAADEPVNKREMEKGDDAFEVGNDDLFISASPMPVHIWLIPTGGGEASRLTSGSWTLPVALPPSPPASPLSWSPDGKSIAFVRQASAHTGDADQSAVQILDVSTGAIRALTGGSLFESFPTFSPDGTRIAYWCYRDHDPFNVNDLFIATASGGAGMNLTQPLDRCVLQCRWMPDGKSVLTGGHDGTRVALWQVTVDSKAKRLELESVNPAWSYWVDVTVGKDGSLAFTGSEPDHPAELYYASSSSETPRRLTDFNRAIAALDLGIVEALEWSGPDGFHEDGVLVYPPGYKPGKKLPLVLLIHGGPQSASTTSFAAFAQLLAARGYLVFMPNYRGSDNLGNAYQHAIFNDAGDGPGRDVMAGLNAVRARGIVDENRLAVTGWSYGGYMTSWLIGHHTIWKAAVAGAAVTDLTDEYCFSDGNVQWRYGFPRAATPWTSEGEKLYREQSPMTYATNARTPTLVLTTTGDARVPPTQSYKLFHALKAQGVLVSMVAYPVPGHFPGDPIRARDVYRRWADWLDKHLWASADQE